MTDISKAEIDAAVAEHIAALDAVDDLMREKLRLLRVMEIALMANRAAMTGEIA